jgi:hypothetical protein
VADRSGIKPEALIVGYALSRLDRRLLSEMGWSNWNAAYDAAAKALKEKRNSIKQLRDEFDPYFDNGRRGWFQRPMYPTRVAVLHEFENVSDAALVETVCRILSRDVAPLQEVLQTVAAPPTRVSGVAERLLTGRMAEEFFVKSCQAIITVAPADLVDMRLSGEGYDFGVSSRPGVAIEVKGLRKSRGDVLFTDREWSEARKRRADYWLVVVGRLESESPRARLLPDPSGVLSASCSLVQSSAALWRAGVTV